MTTHTATVSRLRRIAPTLLWASFFVAQAAQACPGCKQAVGGDGAKGNWTVNGAGIGYALSIGFMLFTLASILGGLGFMAYRNCMAIAAQQREAHEAAFAASSRT